MTSPTGYGWTLDDPLRGEADDAAELEIGTAAAWASRILSPGNSNTPVRSEIASCADSDTWVDAGCAASRGNGLPKVQGSFHVCLYGHVLP